MVGNGEVKADDSKVSTVTTWLEFTFIKHIQQFLGFANYYDRYIANFAILGMSLADFLQKHIGFHWGEEQQRAFDAFILALTSTQVLALPNLTLSYTVVNDASAFGVGAIL